MTYETAARAYEAQLDRDMDEAMDDHEDKQCDHDDFYDGLEAERRMER